MTDAEPVDLLVRAAREARENAYDLGGRGVGAAVLAGGTVFTGVTVDNRHPALSLCAERVAVGSAVAAGERELTAIAIAGGGRGLHVPCGACLQVLAEFGSPDTAVMLVPESGPPRMRKLKELLAAPFDR